MAKHILFVNPPVQVVSRWQLLQYPEPYPYGLLKLGTLLKKQKVRVSLIDMMEYAHYRDSYLSKWPSNAHVHSVKHAGGPGVKDALRPSYLLGQPMDFLRDKLQNTEKPDEIWVTSCLTFNWETAHEAIAVCKQVFPDVPVRFGGNYPSLLPEHAATSQADEIVQGKVEEAETEFGDLSLYETPPEIGIFNLATGCSNRCSFCINHRWQPTLRFSPKRLLYYLLSVRKTFGIRHFANWDPNVMLFPDELNELLDLLIEARTDLTFSFNMGIQSNKVTPEIAEKMLKAGVTQMTIPFETSDPVMLKRFHKPYRFGAPVRTLRLLRDVGFQLGRFHSCSLFGFDDEATRYLFRTYLTMVILGARPIFSPLAPVPGSEEFERLRPQLEGKPYEELNGYLFPLLGSKEKVELYDTLIALCHQTHVDEAAVLARTLPPKIEREFFEELEFVEKELLHPDSAFASP